jgi:hypothetical protein
MDMTQQLAVLSLTHTEGRTLGNHHTPRSNSPASTHSGSSPGASQGKASMDIERNARPFPDKFTRSFLTSPSRRMASMPLPFPSHLDMDRPISSTFPDSSDSYASIASFQASARNTESASGSFSSTSCAATIAARTAAAYSTPQSTPAALTLSHLLPTSTHLSSHQRAYTTPQQLSSREESVGASSLDVLSDGQDVPLPPIERVSNHPASLTPGFPPIRMTASRPGPTPLPTKFSIEGVSARLSPAIITRQPQHPILSLPPISPTLPPANDSRRLRSGSLRSVPALPMEGSDDREPAEHDNADLDDLDEEDEGVVDGDEDAEEESPEAEHPDTASEDGESSSGPHSSEASRPGNLPAIDVSPLDLSLSFQNANMSGTIRQDDNKTPKVHQMSDYFNSKRAEPASHILAADSQRSPTAWASAWVTPGFPTSAHSFNGFAPTRAPSTSRALPTPTTPILNSRSGMYHQASRSMSDMAEILRQHRTPEVPAATPKSPLRHPVHEAEPVVLDTEEPDTDTQLGPSLHRRLSMPTFGPSTEPPPYPAFRFGEPSSTIQIEPPDEEGYEHLPHYTNHIYLRAIMPRKMEFTAPGVQARDRKWRRTLCILEGTAFRVYSCPPTATGKGLIGNLWEKTVGVGDIAATPSTETSSTSAKVKEREVREREREARQTKLDSADGTITQSPTSSPTLPSTSGPSQPSNDSEDQPSPSSTRSRLLPSNFRRKNRAASDAPSTSRLSSSPLHQIALDSISSQGPSPPTYLRPPTPRTPSDQATPVLGGASRTHTHTPRTTPRAKRRHLWVDDPAVPLPQEEDLLYAYQLHNAESGLGSDYLKRRNVIRIRMEGQQFLLQARDVASVVDWIEVRGRK